MVKNEYFSKIPNKLFYIKNKKSIFQIIKDYNVLFVLDYLYTNTNRRNQAVFTIEDIVRYCGLKPDTHKGKSNEKIKYIVKSLKELKLINDDIDYNLLGTKGNKSDKDILYATLTIFNKNEKGEDIAFVTLTDEEKNKIINVDIKLDKLKLLFYYLYLKSRIYKRSNEFEGNLISYGGRAESCYVSFEKINEDIGLTADTIDKYNQILVDLNLIRYDRAELWYFKNDPNKIIYESCNVYVLYNNGDFKANLKEGIKQYKLNYSDARVFVKDEYVYNNKRINGKIGRLGYLIDKGKATPEQIQERDDLIRFVNIEKSKYNIVEVLNNKENKGKLLSELMGGKYIKLEEELKLVEEGKLLIDWEYYKWIMTNYKEDEHDYYINCVRKHKIANKDEDDFDDLLI